ncbi:MAG: protein BatD [Candidatus Omnitrophica bacterium]|nr:protein BatD [Candidatus Omnitrophota bacterium]
MRYSRIAVLSAIHVLLQVLMPAASFAGVLEVNILVPDRVVVGSIFEMEIRVTVDAGRPPQPEIPGMDGLVISPVTGFHSTQIINNRITQIFRYSCRATKEGTYSLKGITAENKPAAPKTIQAIKATAGNPQDPGKPHPPIFVEAEVDKKEIWQGSQLTYDLYLYRRDVTPRRLGANLEDVLKPFGAVKVDDSLIPRGRQVVTVGGNKYEKTLAARYVLFPLEPGELTIPPVRLRGEVVASRNSGDLFNAFFGGVDIDQLNSGPVLTQPIKVKVNPLPEEGKPKGFSGAVGQSFTFSCELSKRQVNVGETFTMALRIKGSGNINSIKQPELNFPDWIEVYDTERKAADRYNDDRLIGEVAYDYVLIARKEGKVILNPIEFSYFGSADGKYVTLKQGPFSLEVLPGQGQGVTYLQGRRKRIRVTGEDFRHIRTNNVRLADESRTALRSPFFWSVFSAPWLCLAGVAFKRRREDYLLRNPQVSERIRARGSIRNRLAASEKRVGEPGTAFFNEIENALHEILSAQLGEPTRGKTRDQLQQILRDHFLSNRTGQKSRMSEEALSSWIDLLEQLDLMRFSPGADDISQRRNLLEEARKILLEVKNL